MTRRLLLLAGLLACLPVYAKQKPVPPLVALHQHPSGAFTFRTPEDWKVGGLAGDPLALEARGDGVIVRFVYRQGDVGYDTLHVDCMMQRLAGPFETSPEIKYEYDFLSGVVGEMRILDSAFVTTYDDAIQGERQWRQRNLTITGAGHSLCAISYVPVKLWKKSKPIRELVDNVVKSVEFAPR